MLRSSSSIPLLALVLALLFPQGAEASWFQPHTIQEDVPFKDVERSLTNPLGLRGSGAP